jgi:hypothetical protein
LRALRGQRAITFGANELCAEALQSLIKCAFKMSGIVLKAHSSREFDVEVDSPATSPFVSTSYVMT